MPDFELPSFSLGLDFDLDSQPQQELTSNRNPQPVEGSPLDVPTSSVIQEDPVDDDDDFETPSTVLEPPRSLKRLRRGSTSDNTSWTREVKPKLERLDVDDEIEEFSEEDQQLGESVRKQQHSSMGSSSKLTLHGHGVLASQSSMQLKGIKNKAVENLSASTNNVESTSKLIFPKLTISPLRKFQLIDSDSDSEEPCVGQGLNSKANQLHSSSNGRYCNQSQVIATADPKTAKESFSLPQNEDLWKEVCSDMNFQVPTPALDEVCEEYFRTVKDTDKSQNCLGGCYEINSGKHNQQNCSLTSVPPAHQYYLHDDPRIRALVRTRLPNFFPLGSGSNQENRQQNASTIDYMGQFIQGEGSKLAKQSSCKPSTSKRQKNVRNTAADQELSGAPEGWVNTRSSAGVPKDAGKRTARNSKVQGQSQGSETTWVNPRSSAGIPKDAGKRRVQAVEGSVGHWYTSDGRRVYVSKNGQELTGQIAYRQYRRESGAGFRRSKKKAPSKKKTSVAAKKKK